MKLLDPTYIRDSVDYSFGDQSSEIHNIFNGYIKIANNSNDEFLEVCKKLHKEGKKIITLFIDNIRLYYRENIKYTPIELSNESAKAYKDNRVRQFKNQDLLKLCSEIEWMNFIIFTNFEDTPIDEEIENKIPVNVISIHACNSEYFSDKVIPFPYGLQRKMNPYDDRHSIIQSFISNEDIKPTKMMYSNFDVVTNSDRIKIKNLFLSFDWCTTESSKNYHEYLTSIKNHKFVICPEGNGIDTHRLWEVIYMKRVPILIKRPFLEKLLSNIPVLFVDNFNEVDLIFLNKNIHLFYEISNYNLNNLDIESMYNNIIKFNN